MTGDEVRSVEAVSVRHEILDKGELRRICQPDARGIKDGRGRDGHTPFMRICCKHVGEGEGAGGESVVQHVTGPAGRRDQQETMHVSLASDL